MNNLKSVLLPFGEEIYQTLDGQGISSDTQFLVDTILNEERFDECRLLELGSGNGIISIMLKYYHPNWQITGYEMQPHLVDLSKENASSLQLDINFIVQDIRDDNSSDNRFDLIVSNPPYIKVSDGRISPNRERAIARQEITCTMQNILKNVTNNLTDKGNAYLMYPENRLEELLETTKKVDLKVLNRFLLKKGKKRVFVAKITRI